MANPPDDSDSTEYLADDGQLKIRIPNPKVYMARQTLWTGQRGKPRCDNCRLNNLKCDRVLPTCNQCSWTAGGDCRYTPLPTPAHRGIPRCDRCRLRNLKCDRNLPVCNYCGQEGDTECNYTPKKRNKAPTDNTLVDEQDQKSYPSFIHVQDGSIGSKKGQSFYGLNIASPGKKYSPSYNKGEYSDPETLPYSQTGRFTAQYRNPTQVRNTPLPLLAPKPPPPPKQLSFISHFFPQEQRTSTGRSSIEPWFHPSFAALPETVLLHLRATNSGQMPNRNTFEEELAAFLNNLMPELRQTACLNPDIYATVARSLREGETSTLSTNIRAWTSYHHLCSGSDKCNLILIPRDEYFKLSKAQEEKLRNDYSKWIDGKASARDVAHLQNHSPLTMTDEHDANAGEWMKAFERLPVQSQIYDILAYAHRSHGSSLAMVSEVRRLAIASITWPMTEIFTRLCPHCNLQNKQENSVI